MLSNTTCFLIGALVLVILFIFIDYAYRHKKSNKFKLLPLSKEFLDNEKLNLSDPLGPKPWPIIGSLHILRQYEVPCMAFADLAQHYNSEVIKIKLGSVSCVVVSGLENIKEVLISNGDHFDSRPNFIRYHQLFNGNKNNSLAFSDWSDVQETRRKMLAAHTFPPMDKKNFKILNDVVANETSKLVSYISTNDEIIMKQFILHSCANVFSRYFCSTSFKFGDLAFREMIRNFDKVFYEINQGYAVDFMPFLMPLYYFHMSRMADCSRKIREFIKKNIIKDRFDTWNDDARQVDYVDCLLNHTKTNSEPYLSWDMALFALEDIFGGHSAIGNLLVKIFGCLVTRPDVQNAAQKEIDSLKIGKKVIGLKNKKSLPYIEAIILEIIRFISSPIVPHIASRDSSIAGYKVEKDTFIFLNNYDLNMSKKLWGNPKEFEPKRFIKNGRLTKPKHFLPFGGGKRKCMGYKIVEYLSFSIVANVLKNFRILPIENMSYEVPIGNLAMPEVTFECKFKKRRRRNRKH